MATDKDPPCQSCITDPNYAIICSFFDKFAQKCGINHFNFLDLQEMLENTVEVRQPLIDLHIKLLRKARKSCSADKWERVVTKFCHSYSKQDGWELERFGYKNSRIEVKLRLLKHLLEAQFDSNAKFKSEVNKLTASELRVEPLGRDQNGQTYWCQFDPSCNIRIYKEDPDEEESWDLIAKDRVGLVGLIDELSSGEGQKELNSILNEDSNSLEIEKPITDTGQVSSGTSPPEIGTDESLSQEIKQYSDSTNGSAEITTKESPVNCDSDSNSRHPNHSSTNPDVSVKCVSKSEGVKLAVETNGTVTAEPTVVQEVRQTAEVPIDNEIAEAKLDVIDVPNQINDSKTVKSDDLTSELDGKNQNGALSEKSFTASLSPDVPSDLSQKQTASDSVKPKSDEPLDNRIPSPLSTQSNVPEKLVQDLSSKSVPSNSKNVTEPLSLVNSVINLRSVSPTTVISKEEEKPCKSSSASDQNSNSSEDDSSLKVIKTQPVSETLKNLSSRISITKKIKGPPGSKLDEIFKFKRVHDPSTPTNLPPQSQPIPAYIGPGVKDSVLAQIKEGFGTNDSKREVTITSRSAPDKYQPERSPMSSSLKERLGEITQRLTMRQIDITPLRSTSSEPLKAEDLTKPKPKVPKELEEPEVKKLKLLTEPEFSEAVEEPLMLVRGEGSGADCNTSNPVLDIDFFKRSQLIGQDEPEFGEAIEEPVMFFFGEGSGADCDTGNPELEKKTQNADHRNENDDNTPNETVAESSQEKKVHKLWSIDTICNKEMEQNCEDPSKQFFFGPGSVKNFDKSEKPPEPKIVSNNNSLDKANCDIPEDCSKATESENAFPESSSANDQATDSKPVKLKEEDSCKSESSLTQMNEKSHENTPKIGNEESSKRDLMESNSFKKSFVDLDQNKESTDEGSMGDHRQTEEDDAVGDTSEQCKSIEEGSNKQKMEETESGTKEDEDKSNNFDVQTKSERILKSNDLNESENGEKQDCDKNKSVAELEEKLSEPEVIIKEDKNSENNDTAICELVKADRNEVAEVANTEVSESKENTKTIEDEQIAANTHDGDVVKEDVKPCKSYCDDKIQVKTEEDSKLVDEIKNEEKFICEAVTSENMDQNKTKIESISSDVKIKDSDFESVKVEPKVECKPDDEKSSKAVEQEDSKLQEPEIQEKINDLSNTKNKSKQICRATRRSSKASKEELKVETDEFVPPDVIEPRRPRRSAAVISTQLSENIIKPRGKKPPPPKKDEKKPTKKNEPEKKIETHKKIEPEKTEQNSKGNKKTPALPKGGKGKKIPAKRGGSRKSSVAQDEGDVPECSQENAEEEKKPVEEEQPKKMLGLNSFSFDVDDSGNIPLPVIPPSRKRKLDKVKSDVEDDLGSDGDDVPLEIKKRRLPRKGKFGKRKRKGKQSPKKKDNKEPKESLNSGDEEASHGEKEKKKNQDENATEEKPKIKKPVTKTKTLLGLTERDLMGVETVLTGELSASGRSVRTSRRIAQIKIKEQEEERKLHEQTLQEIKQKEKELGKKKSKKIKEKDEKKPTKKRVSAKISDGDFTPYDQDSNDTLQKKKGRPRKKKEKFKYDINNPWKSSSGSGSSEEDNDDLEHYDIEEEDEDEDPRAKVLVSDHEFSPESDLEKEGDEGIPVRHARTALKVVEIKEEEDDKACQKCGKSDHPEWILLCDKCDNGWHGSCLRPALMIVPEGDWFCPPCQHLSLVEKLKETLRIFERDSKRRENDELRRKRLAYVGISLSNVLPPPGTKVKLDDSSSESSDSSRSDDDSRSGSSSESSSYEDEPVYQLRVRKQTTQSYRFNDYDNLINSAIQDDFEEVPGLGTQSRGKDIENIIEAERDEANGVDNGNEDDEEHKGGEGWRPSVVPRKSVPLNIRKKARKLTNIDVSSGDDQDSDEDFKGSSHSSEDEDSGDYSSGSDYGRSKWKSKPVRRSTRARTSRLDREFINDDSEESDAPRRKKSRKVWSETESESDESWGRRKKKPSAKVSSRNKGKKKSKYSDSDSDLPRRPKSKKSKNKVRKPIILTLPVPKPTLIPEPTSSSRIPFSYVYTDLDPSAQVKYGLSEDEEDYGRRTRGKKINYQESDSDENTPQVVKQRRVIESEDEDDFKPDPSDKKKAILSDSEEEDDSEDDDEEDIQDREEEEDEEDESDKGDNKLEEKEVEEGSKDESEIMEKTPEKPKQDEKVSETVTVEPKATPPVIPPPRIEVTRTQIVKESDKSLSDVEMFVGDVEEEDEEEEEELEEELEEEEEDDDELDEKRMGGKINIPSPVRALENKPEISLTIKSVNNLKSVKDKMVEEELNDELISVPGPISKVIPVPVPVSEIKESVKEVEKLEEKEEKKPDPPKVNTIRIVPQHKLMANPPPPQLDVKPIMMRPRVPGPHNMPAYPGMRFPSRPPLMKHQFPSQFPPQYPPYYPQHYSDEYPSGYGPPSVHPQQVPSQVPSAPYPHPSGVSDEGEFGGLVSYFSSQHEDNLDS